MFNFDEPIVIRNRTLDPHNQIICKLYAAETSILDRLRFLPYYFLRRGFVKVCQTVMPIDKKLEVIETYDEYIGTIKFRYYAAKTKTKDTIMYFHGGAFAFGNIESHDGICRMITRACNKNVILFEYRLSPEYQYPAALEDSFDVYQYLKKQLKLENHDITFMGESAGGNLALALSQYLEDRDYKQPNALILVVPPTSELRQNMPQSAIDFEKGPSRLDLESCLYYTEKYTGGKQSRNPYVFPILRPSFAYAPRTLIVTAGFDVLHDDGVSLYHKMLADNPNIYHICFETLTHEFLFLYHHIPIVKNLFTIIRSFTENNDAEHIKKQINTVKNDIVQYEMSETRK